MTDLIDAAIDYVERTQRINALERPTDAGLPKRRELADAIKAGLLEDGNEHAVARIDHRTGEIVQALELPTYNVRLFLRETPATYMRCQACGAETRTRSESRSLVMEAIEDLAAAARAPRRGPES